MSVATLQIVILQSRSIKAFYLIPQLSSELLLKALQQVTILGLMSYSKKVIAMLTVFFLFNSVTIFPGLF